MKRIICSTILFMIVISASCNPFDSQMETPTTTSEGTPTMDNVPTDASPGRTGLVKSDLSRETNPQVSPEEILTLANDNNQFASAFYQEIRHKEGNLIFSPFSLSLALAMTLSGAETSTEEDMLSALQFSLPEPKVHPAFNALLLAIESSEEQKAEEMEGSVFQLNIANSIWGQSDYAFNPAFLDVLAQNYGAGMNLVDYKTDPEGARVAINNWIGDETQEKIQDLIPPGTLSALTRLVLANAIYFNGSWRNPFEKNSTQQTPFFLLDGAEITVDMMKLFRKNIPYGKGDAYQAVQLPYLSPDFVMTLIVPDEGEFNQFEEELSAEMIEEIIIRLTSSQPVDLQMPKFDFEASIDARGPLSNLGMSEAFDPDQADYSGITEVEGLYISDVLHKATITVDEDGTEAAAATVVIVTAKAAEPEEPISLIINRPFIFLIQHKPTGSILFMGRVLQP